MASWRDRYRPEYRFKLSHYHDYRQPTLRILQFQTWPSPEIMSLRRRVYALPVPKMPPGVVELMDGLARDVLKNNPENIYEFCAHHMQKLLEMRDGRAQKPFVTLDQKIAKAQMTVRLRAEQRRREFDNQIHLIPNNCNNQETVTPSKAMHNTGSDLDFSDKQEIITVQTNCVQQKEVEIPLQVSSTGIHNDEVVYNQDEPLYTPAEMEIKEDSENAYNSNVETLDFNIKQKDSKANSTMECDNTDNSLKDGLSIENNVVIHEIQSTHFDTKCADKNVVDDNIRQEQMASITGLEFNEKTDGEIVITQHNSEFLFQKEDTDSIVQGDFQTQIQETIVQNTTNEISSTNNLTDNAPSAPIVTASNDSVNELSINGSLNHSSDKSEDQKDSIDNHGKDLNEPQKQQEDEKILAIILNEPDYVQCNESDLIRNNDIDPKLKRTSDNESAAETKYDKGVNSSMDLETAAITIQKVFRSFLFKTKTASYDDSTTVDLNLLNEDKEKEETDTLNIKDRRSLGISRMDTVLQTVNEEKSLSLSTDDSSTFSSAATIIQAHVRGFLVRNKFNSNKTTSTNSLIDSEAHSIHSLEGDSDNRKNKTVLNIHIVPEGSHFVSRDESILTSMDLSLDGSPPSSVNLHPLGYDKSERRKQLKREDAIQSVSPPSNNSGKLSDDLDSVKEVLVVDTNHGPELPVSDYNNIPDSTPNIVINGEHEVLTNNDDYDVDQPTAELASDEMDVVTPFVPVEGRHSRESINSSKLLHSGEFHDIVVPTNVTRSDTSVVREFQNVLVYFILWNN